MIDIKAAVDEILANFDDSEYPVGYIKKYIQLECLAEGRGIRTFLVKQKNCDKLYVTKCYDKNIYHTVHESRILQSLSKCGLPAFEDEFQNDNMVCITREYMPGLPLDEYIREHKLTREVAIDICVQLCDILTYLNGQADPVIHRDIKPSNIIVKPDNKIGLIDFDISRVYKSDAKSDTQFFGTREFAPPEQYGFSQTDHRTDIFSLGIVMGWMLTGKTDIKEVIDELGSDKLSGIYKKCTAFSPDNRYESAVKLKKALISVDDEPQKKTLKWLAGILSCILFLCVGFYIGRYTNYLSDAFKTSGEVSFEEPMIERAVRLQLKKEADEVITEEELLAVTELHIFGDSLVAKTADELNNNAKQLFDSNQMKPGSVKSLSDLTKMPNLKGLSVAMQNITDISSIAELMNLEALDLKNNPFSDISALGQLKFLKRVGLFDTRVTDLSPLASCPMLTELDVGKLPISFPNSIAELKKLQKLSLFETTIDSLSGIEEFQQLTFLELSGVLDGELTELLLLQNLEGVVLGESMRQAAEEIREEAEFEISLRQD